MQSEFVLLFKPSGKTHILDQLSKAYDKHSYPGSMDKQPSLIIVSEETWFLIEGELQPMLASRYKTIKERGYDKVQGKIGDIPKPQSGYNALSYRARPIVAIDGHNIIAERVQ